MPPEKQILVIQHTVTEKLGILEQHLKNINVTYNYVKPFLGDILPANSNEFAGLIVLGGPQSGYQEMEYPYLIDEKRYIKQALLF
jgi:GMP synthase (glutamine-hydrolysing)